MARKSQNSKSNKRLPLSGRPIQLKPARIRTTPNGLRYSVTVESPALSTDASGVSTGWAFMNPANYTSAQLGQVGRLFQEYKVHKFTIKWIPLLGATTGGNVRITFVDNSEVMYKITNGAYSISDLSLIASQATHVRRGALWQPFEYSAPAVIGKRRPIYQFDTSTYLNSEQVDRILQGMCLVYINGPANLTGIGYLALHFDVELRLPIPTTLSPLFAVAGCPDGGLNPSPPVRRDPPPTEPGKPIETPTSGDV